MRKISAPQLEALKHCAEAGYLVRYAGGFWSSPGVDFRPESMWYTGLQTLRSLEARGLLRRDGEAYDAPYGITQAGLDTLDTVLRAQCIIGHSKAKGEKP